MWRNWILKSRRIWAIFSTMYLQDRYLDVHCLIWRFYKKQNKYVNKSLPIKCAPKRNRILTGLPGQTTFWLSFTMLKIVMTQNIYVTSGDSKSFLGTKYQNWRWFQEKQDQNCLLRDSDPSIQSNNHLKDQTIRWNSYMQLNRTKIVAYRMISVWYFEIFAAPEHSQIRNTMTTNQILGQRPS